MSFLQKKKVKQAVPRQEITEDQIEDLEEEVSDKDEEAEAPKPTIKNNLPIWVVQDIPTETQKVIVNTKTKKAYDLYTAVVEILNRTEE